MELLQDKVIVVTGGSGLLGHQMCETFRLNGAKVLVGDVNFRFTNEFNYYLDITNFDSVASFIENIVADHGRIDGWVNNAYPKTTDWNSPFSQISLKSWRENVDSHLNGYFLCSQLILEQMKSQGFGSLVNMSSIYGKLGPDFSLYSGLDMTMPAAYAAIKGGINNFTRFLASNYGPSNVRINTVSPGGIFNSQHESFIDKYVEKVPLKRMGVPEDVSNAVMFLLSDQSNYITGHNLMVDGGYSIV